MTIICEPDLDRAAAIASNVHGPVAVVDTLVDAAIALAAGTEPPVVVGAAADADAVASFTSELRSTRSDAVVVVLRPDVDEQVTEQMTAAGVTHVLEADHPERLVDVLSPAVRADSHRGSIATVFSAKGGTGTTTVAVNLAAALHASTGGSVCLVDLDLAFGDVAIALGLAPERNVADAVAGSLDTEVSALLTTAERLGVDCVLAPVDPARGEAVSVELVAELLEVLRGRYDHVVVDTASQLSEVVLAALDVADHHVLVTAPEVAAVKNLRLTLDMFDLLDYPSERRVIVLNKAGSAKSLSADEVTAALGQAAEIEIPHTVDAVDALNRGEPLTVLAPSQRASVAIRELAARVGGIGKTPARSARRGLRWRKRSA
jgi:pilus assembly protein CpaE